MTPAETLSITLAEILAAMVVLWAVSLVRRDAGIVDPFWGAGFVIVAWTAAALQRTPVSRVLLLDSLVTAWGLRLCLYLLWRNCGHGEDRRYSAMREHHGPRFWRVSLISVFLLQGLLLWFIALPVQVAAVKSVEGKLGWLDAAGVLLWLTGFAFEAVGDWQLARFKSNPGNAGRVLDRGLWRYTRHPNYFGDFCVWWGLYFIAAAGGAAWTIASPVVMSVLLMRVSGVTLLEATIGDRRPGYAAYQRRTNAFFPGPPKE
jgi:steroid 5-alpha reductase family enzyme